jgi:protocatechuate 3,4-dioxygenase beta subunit
VTLENAMNSTAADDRQAGNLLSRRRVLGLLGASGVLALAGSRGLRAEPEGPSGCVVRPQQTEGPYFVDEALNRIDIRSDPSDGSVRPGTPLEIAFKVSRLSPKGCEPLTGALVDVWHCDHLGVYSDVEDPGFNTVGRKFLRGYQVTDSRGAARFKTIYPGWYPGRTVHVHFKIRSAPSLAPGYEFASQLYFDDRLTDEVHARQPNARKGQRTRRNAADGIFLRGGSQLLLSPVRKGDGYAASFPIALQIA